jgi:GTP-binding protein YchF
VRRPTRLILIHRAALDGARRRYSPSLFNFAAGGAMKAGLVGYAQSGKTTLFSALTGLQAGARAQVNLGAIKVPDPRIDALSALYKPKKTTFAEMRFVDVPGPRSKGSGLDAEALRALAEVDAFCLVVRGFPAPDGTPADPARELSDFDAELVLHDLGVVEKRLDRMRKEHGKGTNEYQELERLHAQLDPGNPLRSMGWSDAEAKELAHYDFLSRRPLLVVVNVPEDQAAAPVSDAVAEAARARHAEAISLCASVEAEIAQLDPAEQPAFLESLGLTEPARARFLRAAYGLLDLVSFFTVGEDEVRAWPIHRGDRAPRAAGRIHSDLERGFIRAEVMHYDEFVAAGSEHKARLEGKLRLEGKEYVVKDGDILNIRFAV